MHLHHLALVSANVPRLSAFYRDVVGLTPVAPPRPSVAWFDLGGTLLMIEPVSHAKSRALDDDARHPSANDAPVPLAALVFAIPASERDARRASLVTHGVTIERESEFTIYFADPDGTPLGFSHYPLAARVPASS